MPLVGGVSSGISSFTPLSHFHAAPYSPHLRVKLVEYGAKDTAHRIRGYSSLELASYDWLQRVVKGLRLAGPVAPADEQAGFDSQRGSPPISARKESCRTMPLVCGFSWESPVSLAFAFPALLQLTSLHSHRLSRFGQSLHSLTFRSSLPTVPWKFQSEFKLKCVQLWTVICFKGWFQKRFVNAVALARTSAETGDLGRLRPSSRHLTGSINFPPPWCSGNKGAYATGVTNLVVPLTRSDPQGTNCEYLMAARKTVLLSADDLAVRVMYYVWSAAGKYGLAHLHGAAGSSSPPSSNHPAQAYYYVRRQNYIFFASTTIIVTIFTGRISLSSPVEICAVRDGDFFLSLTSKLLTLSRTAYKAKIDEPLRPTPTGVHKPASRLARIGFTVIMVPLSSSSRTEPEHLGEDVFIVIDVAPRDKVPGSLFTLVAADCGQRSHMIEITTYHAADESCSFTFHDIHVYSKPMLADCCTCSRCTQQEPVTTVQPRETSSEGPITRLLWTVDDPETTLFHTRLTIAADSSRFCLFKAVSPRAMREQLRALFKTIRTFRYVPSEVAQRLSFGARNSGGPGFESRSDPGFGFPWFSRNRSEMVPLQRPRPIPSYSTPNPYSLNNLLRLQYEVDRFRWLRTKLPRVPTSNYFSANTSSDNGMVWILVYGKEYRNGLAWPCLLMQESPAAALIGVGRALWPMSYPVLVTFPHCSRRRTLTVFVTMIPVMVPRYSSTMLEAITNHSSIMLSREPWKPHGFRHNDSRHGTTILYHNAGGNNKPLQYYAFSRACEASRFPLGSLTVFVAMIPVMVPRYSSTMLEAITNHCSIMLSREPWKPHGFRHNDVTVAMMFSYVWFRNLICTVQRYGGNTARLARMGDEALGVRGHGGRVVRRSGFNPGRVTPDFRMWESCRTMPLDRWVFLGDISFPPPFPSGAAPYSPQSPSSALKTSMLRAVLSDMSEKMGQFSIMHEPHLCYVEVRHFLQQDKQFSDISQASCWCLLNIVNIVIATSHSAVTLSVIVSSTKLAIPTASVRISWLEVAEGTQTVEFRRGAVWHIKHSALPSDSQRGAEMNCPSSARYIHEFQIDFKGIVELERTCLFEGRTCWHRRGRKRNYTGIIVTVDLGEYRACFGENESTFISANDLVRGFIVSRTRLVTCRVDEEEKERELSYDSDGGRPGNDGFRIIKAPRGLWSYCFRPITEECSGLLTSFSQRVSGCVEPSRRHGDFYKYRGRPPGRDRLQTSNGRRRSATTEKEVCDCKYQAVECAAGRLDYWTSFRMWVSSDTMPTYETPGVTRPGIEPVLPRGSHVCPAFSFRLNSILTSITLIGSQELVITNSRQFPSTRKQPIGVQQRSRSKLLMKTGSFEGETTAIGTRSKFFTLYIQVQCSVDSCFTSTLSFVRMRHGNILEAELNQGSRNAGSNHIRKASRLLSVEGIRQSTVQKVEASYTACNHVSICRPPEKDVEFYTLWRCIRHARTAAVANAGKAQASARKQKVSFSDFSFSLMRLEIWNTADVYGGQIHNIDINHKEKGCGVKYDICQRSSLYRRHMSAQDNCRPAEDFNHFGGQRLAGGGGGVSKRRERSMSNLVSGRWKKRSSAERLVKKIVKKCSLSRDSNTYQTHVACQARGLSSTFADDVGNTLCAMIASAGNVTEHVLETSQNTCWKRHRTRADTTEVKLQQHTPAKWTHWLAICLYGGNPPISYKRYKIRTPKTSSSISRSLIGRMPGQRRVLYCYFTVSMAVYFQAGKEQGRVNRGVLPGVSSEATERELSPLVKVGGRPSVAASDLRPEIKHREVPFAPSPLSYSLAAEARAWRWPSRLCRVDTYRLSPAERRESAIMNVFRPLAFPELELLRRVFEMRNTHPQTRAIEYLQDVKHIRDTISEYFKIVEKRLSHGKMGTFESPAEDPREDPPTSGIVLHDSHIQESWSDPAGDRTRIALVGDEWANRSATLAPMLRKGFYSVTTETLHALRVGACVACIAPSLLDLVRGVPTKQATHEDCSPALLYARLRGLAYRSLNSRIIPVSTHSFWHAADRRRKISGLKACLQLAVPVDVGVDMSGTRRQVTLPPGFHRSLLLCAGFPLTLLRVPVPARDLGHPRFADYLPRGASALMHWSTEPRGEISLLYTDDARVYLRYQTDAYSTGVRAQFRKCSRVGNGSNSGVATHALLPLADTLSIACEVANVSMEQRRNERAAGIGDLRENPADQRHRPARFSLAKIRSELAGDSTWFPSVGGEQSKNNSGEEKLKISKHEKFIRNTRSEMNARIIEGNMEINRRTRRRKSRKRRERRRGKKMGRRSSKKEKKKDEI
ncbi:hypothetical protein PR048_032637 [Dryococelus australis]|uniref:Uncharacterized protein n=1 Tax=Dryococelus australis TaxID=614101 RepID=A0ABQ9G6Z3_9NEOP|nr:hypothetical protein PR048_032637 [Dryococelus australis]